MHEPIPAMPTPEKKKIERDAFLKFLRTIIETSILISTRDIYKFVFFNCKSLNDC